VILGFLRATHPLPAVAVTTLVALVTAFRGGDAATVWWVAGSTAAGQASVGWSNDYLDRHADAAAGRTEKPLVAGAVSPTTIAALALITLLLSFVLSLPVGLVPALVMLFAVSSAWAYNAGVKRTVLSWLPYAVSFGLAPVYVWLTTGGRPPIWLPLGGALLGVGAHLLNVIPDLERDRVTARGGLPHRLGLRGSLLVACTIMIAALAVVLVAGGIGSWSWPAIALAAALVAAVAWSGLTGRTHLSFRLAVASAAAIVLVLMVSPGGLGG
jgi:4-hydroxybenzoate polyprenyltransferase